jgi:hypothetical protein
VTDPNAPTTDPAEDRVRRTFAARAEDMAPGDSAGELPDLVRDRRPAPDRLRGVRRPVLAAAAVVVVVATVAGGAALVARDGDRDAGRLTTAAEQSPPGEADLAAVAAVSGPVDALSNERAVAAATLLGFEEGIALPVTDAAQARAETDAAIASFEAFAAASPDTLPERGEVVDGDGNVEVAYRRGIEGLDGLAELRRDIDAYTGSRDLNNLDTAQDVYDRYAAIVDGLLDGQQRYAGEIQDTFVRTGAIPYARGTRLREQTTRLSWGTLLAVVAPRPGSNNELAQLRTEVQYDMEALAAETADTPFDEAAVTVVADIEDSGVLDLAETAIDGTGDLNELTVGSDPLVDESWPAFFAVVEETLAGET